MAEIAEYEMQYFSLFILLHCKILHALRVIDQRYPGADTTLPQCGVKHEVIKLRE